MVRRCLMISSAVYRFRAMPPPSVGWNPYSRSDLVYRGQVSIDKQIIVNGILNSLFVVGNDV